MYGVLLAAIHQGWDINTWADPPALRYVLGDYVVAEWFLDHGASPNERGVYDDTPLLFAVGEATIPVFQLLFRRGIDIQKGQLLHHATWRTAADRLDVLRLLFDQGLQSSALNKVKYQDIPQDYHFNMYGGIGNTLHNAAHVGYLVEHGVDPLTFGQTPLQLAHDRGMTDMIDYQTPFSLVDIHALPRNDYKDQPGNKMPSDKERQETLIQYYKKYDPGRLVLQDGRMTVRPIDWTPFDQVPDNIEALGNERGKQ